MMRNWSPQTHVSGPEQKEDILSVNHSKWLALDENTPPFPIKVTDTPLAPNYSEISNTPSIAEKPTVTSVPAVVTIRPTNGQNFQA